MLHSIIILTIPMPLMNHLTCTTVLIRRTQPQRVHVQVTKQRPRQQYFTYGKNIKIYLKWHALANKGEVHVARYVPLRIRHTILKYHLKSKE